MTINLKIQKKDLWFLSAIMIFLIGVGYVVAIGSGSYQVQGHDFSELQTCPEGKILKISSGAWTCVDDIDTNTVSGLVTGGGYCSNDVPNSVWGTGYCIATSLPACTSGNTVRETGSSYPTLLWYFICVRN